MRSLTICLLVAAAMASGIDCTIDLSNVDLQNFRYFKYRAPVQPQSSYQQLPRFRNNHGPIRQMIQRHPPQPRQEAGPLAKARAVLGYVSEVLFGNLPGTPEIPVYFHPDSAYRHRERYQRQFGYRGDRLIADLGRGLSPDAQRARLNGL